MRAWRWGAAALALAGAGGVAWGQSTAQPATRPQAQAQPPAQTPAQPPAQAEARAREAAALARRLRERVAEAEQRERSAEREQRAAERALRRWGGAELRPFASDQDFESYVSGVRRFEEAERALESARYSLELERRYLSERSQAKSGQDGPGTPCLPEDKACLDRLIDGEGQSITVSGSRIQALPALTNNQEQGIDEGDVVKQIGQYLLVLQDGRIFVIDTQAGESGSGLRLADRADVYRDPEDEAWYDELVVHGDRVLVTGFAYDAGASELAIFRLAEGGRLVREGVFRIKSEDYYSRDNYAARVVGDELILYTPIPLGERQNRNASFEWPTLRREGVAEGQASGQRLLRPEQLYRPLSNLSRPVIHMVTRCRLGGYSAGADLGCASQGFVASRSRHFYVAGGHAYLWSFAADNLRWEDETPQCLPGYRPARRDAEASFVHRVSLSGGPITAVGATGGPFNQLGMDASGGRFRALVGWLTERCQLAKEVPLYYFDVSAGAFGQTVRTAPDSAFTAMPTITGTKIENRFTDGYLVFGGRPDPQGRRSRDDEEDESFAFDGGGNIVLVPLNRPAEATTMWLPHRVLRVERVGDDAVLTGYEGQGGLDVSLIDLDGGAPRIASTVRLEGRFETEGRSHAFNGFLREDGTGLAGVPTVLRSGEDGRPSWRSAPSDLSFLSIGADGQLSSLGPLRSLAEGDRARFDEDDEPGTGYGCQMSCIDWYGNSRPLFVGDRIFALTATTLVEGRVARGRIDETQRIDLTKTELPGHLPRPTPAAGSD